MRTHNVIGPKPWHQPIFEIRKFLPFPGLTNTVFGFIELFRLRKIIKSIFFWRVNFLFRVIRHHKNSFLLRVRGALFRNGINWCS